MMWRAKERRRLMGLKWKQRSNVFYMKHREKTDIFLVCTNEIKSNSKNGETENDDYEEEKNNAFYIII